MSHNTYLRKCQKLLSQAETYMCCYRYLKRRRLNDQISLIFTGTVKSASYFVDLNQFNSKIYQKELGLDFTCIDFICILSCLSFVLRQLTETTFQENIALFTTLKIRVNLFTANLVNCFYSIAYSQVVFFIQCIFFSSIATCEIDNKVCENKRQKLQCCFFFLFLSRKIKQV